MTCPARPFSPLPPLQRQLTPQQLAALKQQAILKKQIQDQQLKQRILQTGGQAGGSKTVQGVVQRGGQLVRQSGTVRSMTEAEVKQLMAKQQLKVGAGGVVQVPAGTSLTHAQLQQLGIQVGEVGRVLTLPQYRCCHLGAVVHWSSLQVAGSSLVSSPSPLTSATVVKTVQAGSSVAGASTSRPGKTFLDISRQTLIQPPSDDSRGFPGRGEPGYGAAEGGGRQGHSYHCECSYMVYSLLCFMREKKF